MDAGTRAARPAASRTSSLRRPRVSRPERGAVRSATIAPDTAPATNARTRPADVLRVGASFMGDPLVPGPAVPGSAGRHAPLFAGRAGPLVLVPVLREQRLQP